LLISVSRSAILSSLVIVFFLDFFDDNSWLIEPDTDAPDKSNSVELDDNGEVDDETKVDSRSTIAT
jgi:hypothetical protein